MSPTPVGCEFAHDDAAYVLGALTPAERLAFERHLATCAECTESVQLVAGLPGLLGRLPLDDVESPPEPPSLPDTLLPHLLQDVRRQQHRRRWTIGLAAAAAVVVVAAATAVVVVAVDDPPPPATAAAQVMTQVDQDRIDAEVALTSVAWGTRVDLTCSYDASGAGYRQDVPPPTYSLVVRSLDGAVEQVATWKALPGRTMHLTGATALDADQIAGVEVLTSDGRAVLQLTT